MVSIVWSEGTLILTLAWVAVVFEMLRTMGVAFNTFWPTPTSDSAPSNPEMGFWFSVPLTTATDTSLKFSVPSAFCTGTSFR